MHEVTMCTDGKIHFPFKFQHASSFSANAFAVGLHFRCFTFSTFFLCFNIREMEFKRFDFRDEICVLKQTFRLGRYGAIQRNMKRL